MRNINGLRALLLGAAACAAASLAPLVAAQAHPTTFQPSVVPLDETVQVVGKANPQSKVTFQVALNLRDYDGLVQGNQTGRVLTYAELERRHLPTAQEHARVLTWLQRHGMTIESAPTNRLIVTASGTAAAVTRLLGVTFAHVRSEGRDYVSANSQAHVPADLSTTILAVNGLQPHLHAFPLHVIQPMSATAPPLFPQAFLTGYSVPASAITDGGANSTTAIVIDTFPKTKDLKKFWATTGVAGSLANFTFINVLGAVLPAPTGEESLDAETASGVAPNSKIRVYASSSLSFANLDTTFNAVITDLQHNIHIHQVSISLGACESALSNGQLNTDDGLFATMGALGASVFVSTGDSGSHECGKKKPNTPSFYSTSPNVVAVGGTALTLKASGVVKNETGWTGSGGGTSVHFAQPAYQSGAGLVSTNRTVPDISADADPATGALVVLNGANVQIGGTSLSAPLVAGLTALVNSQRVAAAKAPIGGALNTRLYSFIGTSKYRDIVSGSNGGFSAAAGYDLVTGMGAPIMSDLLPALVALP